MDLQVTTLAERPDLMRAVDDFPGAWPEFLFHDSVAAALYDLVTGLHPEYTLVAVNAEEPDVLVAKARTVPVNWPGQRISSLPTGGYDAVLLAAASDLLTHRTGTMVAAIEVVVQQTQRGRGLSSVMLDAVRRNAARLGHKDVVVPVRPNRKHEHPDMTMAHYVGWSRNDGLPVDPWLRVHVRAGARVIGVAECSMTVTGTLDQWRAWTGLAFDRPGPVHVPDALVPVHCDTANGRAVYVEPNVWVHHST